MGRKKRLTIISLLLLLLAIVLQYIALEAIASVKRQQKVQEAYMYGQSVISAIEVTLNNSLEVTRTLKYSYLYGGEEFFEFFDETADDIAIEHNAIGGIYIAPKGIIQCVYPEEYKDSTIGFNMLTDPDQGPRAQLAVDTREITVAGPHKLVEGGYGFIIRNPVFDDNDEFVGFTIIVLDWEQFMDEVVNNSLGLSDKYYFAVIKKELDPNAVTDDYGYIFNTADKRLGNKVEIEFRVPNDTWQLVVEPVDGWRVYKEMFWQIFTSILISLVVIVMIIFIYVTMEKRRILEREMLASEARSSFLSRMSHDIRTPLNGIIGLMEISEMHPDDFELITSNRRKAKVAADHLLSLISDVLELQKMEDRDVVLVEEPFDFIDLATDVMTITAVKAAENGISLLHDDCSAKLKHPYIYGSPLHVRQIILNIIGNAIKYNKPGGSVTCAAEEVYYNTEIVKIKITISDTGIGMSPEFMEHMFDPFSQEHSDARSTYQGTGLGTAIVKSLVDKMGGSIDVESELGQGTVFSVTLPFKIATAEDMPDKNCKKDVKLDGLRILLVEDNELNMEIAESILTDFGAVVTKAVNGVEAVEAFTTNEPGTFDVILMDLMMPLLDGYGATEAIRKFDRPDAKNIPIIAMTANAFAEDVKKCTDAGMNAHLAKPINVDMLVSMLSEVIK